jgi:hypothetical protein
MIVAVEMNRRKCLASVFLLRLQIGQTMADDGEMEGKQIASDDVFPTVSQRNGTHVFP